jgi:DNA polymerase I-like protein with 3'-5' exonuclease and polymerase domains
MDNFFVFSDIADKDNEINKKEAAKIKKNTLMVLKEEVLEEYGTCLGGTYKYVEDTEVLNQLINRCLEETLPYKNKLISIDYETSGLDPHSDIIFIMGFAWENNNSEIECVVFDARKVKESYPQIRKMLTTGRNLAHNGGFEYAFGLSNFDCKTRIAFDSQIARQVGWAGLSKGAALDDIVLEFLQLDMDKTIRKDFPRIDRESPLHNIHFSYNAGDCVTTLLCVPHLIKRLMDEGLWEVWTKIEQPLVSVLAELKYSGVWIDFDAVDELHSMLYKKYEAAIAEYNSLLKQYKFPEDMLFGSSQQIIKAFYEIEGIDLDSTQKSVFERMDHPLAKSIVKCRNLAHMISTYAEPYLNKIPEKTINPDKCGKDINKTTGRVHTELKQCFTDTSRISSSRPNLQNIPSRTKDAKYFRKIFKGPEDHKVIIADYSQIELRILAENADESKMIEIFNKGFEIGEQINCKMLALGKRWPSEEEIFEAAKIDKELGELLKLSEIYDLHRQTAASLYNKKVSEVTRAERGAGKCFHPDTEVLTKSGWKKILELSEGEEIIQAVPSENHEVKLEWVVPLEAYSMKHDSNKLVHLKNYGIDLRVTPDHRMLAWGDNKKHFVTTPEKFNKVRSYTNAGKLTEGSSIDEDLLRVAVATQADGSYEQNAIKFGFSRERKIERLRYLLKKANIPYNESIHKNGKNKDTTSFYIPVIHCERIKSLLDNKKFPLWWINLDLKSREIILDEVKYWDAHQSRDYFLYTSKIKENIDVLQAIASITNRKSRIGFDKSCDIHTLSIRKNNYSRGGNIETKEYSYTNNVACLSVPSTFILARDQGTPIIVGQTVSFGVPYGRGPRGVYEESYDPDTDTYALSIEEASILLQKYSKSYPKAWNHLNKCKKLAFDLGYSKTTSGRKRYYKLPDPRLMSKDDFKRTKGEIERAGCNAPIQSCSADITKLAMVNSYHALNKNFPKAGLLWSVHDELVAHAPKDQQEEVAQVIHDEMIRAAQVWLKKVPVQVGVQIAGAWTK